MLMMGTVLSYPAVVAADRTRPPLPKPKTHHVVSPPARLALSNGLAVRVLPRHQVPLVDVHVTIRAGALQDPDGLFGVAAHTSSMLVEGAGERDASAFSEAVEFLGARLTTSTDYESTSLKLRVPKTRLEAAVALLADALLRPQFDVAEWARTQKKRAAEFQSAREDARILSALAQQRVLFGDARLGFPIEGTEASLRKTTPVSLRQFHRRWYRPDLSFVVVAGDIETSEILPVLERHLGSWRVGGRLPAPPVSQTAAAPDPALRVWWVDRPGAPQSVIAAVAHTPMRIGTYAPAVDVMNTLLGGSFMSRLNQNLREKNQFAYGARSRFQHYPEGSVFVATTAVKTAVTAPALEQLYAELQRIRTWVEDDEATRARNYLAFSFPSAFTTSDDIAALWSHAEREGIDAAQVAAYPHAVLAVSDREILAAARDAIDLSGLSFVIVGDRARVSEGIAQLGLGPIRHISLEELFERPAR